MAGSKGVEVAVGEMGSTVMIGGAKVEVSAEGNNVTVYTNEGVRTKPSDGSVAAKGTQISEDFNTVVLNGVTIEQADGHLVISTPGIVVTKPLPADDCALKAEPANDCALKAEPKPGDKMDDGTIYAGISPETGKPMYTTPADASLSIKWKQAMDYAAGLDAHGHQDWRVPTRAELNVLYDNRDKGALKGTFNVTGSLFAGWYWSSTETFAHLAVWDQRFSDGLESWYEKDNFSSLRCVR